MHPKDHHWQLQRDNEKLKWKLKSKRAYRRMISFQCSFSFTLPSLAFKLLWGWGSRAVVRELKIKLFLPQRCEAGTEAVSLFPPHTHTPSPYPMGDWSKDEQPNLKQKSKCSIRKAGQFLGFACFKGWYNQMAEELVLAWNEEVCLRFTPSRGLGPLVFILQRPIPTKELEPQFWPWAYYDLLHYYY